MPRMRRLGIAIADGILLGIALGILIADARWVEAGAALLFGGGLMAAAFAATPAAYRSVVLPIASLAFALRAATAVVLHVGSSAAGLGGFVTGDDREYYVVARAFVLWLTGRPEPPYVPPYWAGELYLFGTWVYVESALFLLVGALPLVPISLNAALGALTAVLSWGLAFRLHDARSATLAATLVALWPSLILWSALNLKDALALALIMLFLWSVARLRTRPALAGLVAPALVLVLMQSLRGYIFTGLSMLLPIGVWTLTGLPRRKYRLLLAAAAIIGGGALAIDQAGLGLGASLLERSEMYRSGMAVGARTAITPAAPLQVSTGSTFYVPVRDAPPVEPPRVHHVPSEVRIVIGTPPQVTQRGVVHVQPGDVIIVGPGGTTPAPAEARIPLPSAQVDMVRYRPESQGDLVLKTIAYLPLGMLYSLFAPWPWLSERRQDLLTVPEMLLWYALLAGAAMTAWRMRREWRTILVPGIFAAGLLFVFAMVEGNWGTLYRHRSMVIPTVIVLAAPTVLEAMKALRAQYWLMVSSASTRSPNTDRTSRMRRT